MHTLEPIQAELFEQTLDGVAETAIRKAFENRLGTSIRSEIAGHLPGQVKTMGVTWSARLCVPDPCYVLSPGTPVTTVGRRGNTVLVLPYWPEAVGTESGN